MTDISCKHGKYNKKYSFLVILFHRVHVLKVCIIQPTATSINTAQCHWKLLLNVYSSMSLVNVFICVNQEVRIF